MPAMSMMYELTAAYWNEAVPGSQTFRHNYGSAPVFDTLAEALSAGHTQLQLAEWSMPHRMALDAGEISRLEFWMRRPPVLFTAAIWEIMRFGFSSGEFPSPLVEVYIERNGDVWPLLEEAGFQRDADNDRDWSSYEARDV
jgi:hypothetical protein